MHHQLCLSYWVCRCNHDYFSHVFLCTTHQLPVKEITRCRRISVGCSEPQTPSRNCIPTSSPPVWIAATRSFSASLTNPSVKLQLVQNSAARIMTRTPSTNHITPVLPQLHRLPVQFRIKFKVLLLTFKAVHNLAPPYLSDLAPVPTPSDPFPPYTCLSPLPVSPPPKKDRFISPFQITTQNTSVQNCLFHLMPITMSVVITIYFSLS